MDEINRELRAGINNKIKSLPSKNKNKSSRRKKFRIIGSDPNSLIKTTVTNTSSTKDLNFITDYMQDDTIIGLKTILEHSVINYKTDITGFVPLPLPTTTIHIPRKHLVTKINEDNDKINRSNKNMAHLAIINPTNNLETITVTKDVTISKDIPLKVISSIFNQYISSAKNTREQWNTLLGNALEWKGSRAYTKSTPEGNKLYVSYSSDPPTSESDIVLTSTATDNSFKFSKNIDPADPEREVYLDVQAECVLNQDLSESGNVLFQNTTLTNNLNINSSVGSGLNGLVVKNGSEVPINLKPSGEIIVGSGVVEGKLIVNGNSVTGITNNIPIGSTTTNYLLPTQKAVYDYSTTIGSVGPQGYIGLMSILGTRGPQGYQGASVLGVKGSFGGMGETGSDLIGSVGMQGPAGDDKMNGPQGFMGITGITGFAGDDGQIGFIGVTGDTGLRGPQGLYGNTGPTGHTGYRGFQGVQGIIGPSGIQGPQGFLGVQGPQGSTTIGPDGFMGIQGNTGLLGVQGIQGIRGVQGPSGSIGFQGPQGISLRGIQGISGTGGPQGYVGFVGIAGSGLTGYQGVQGLTGITKEGVQGEIGYQGNKGSFITKGLLNVTSLAVFGKNSHGIQTTQTISIPNFKTTVIGWGFSGPNHVVIDISFTYSPTDPDLDPITDVYFDTGTTYFPFPDIVDVGGSFYFIGNSFVRYATLNNSSNPRRCFIFIDQLPPKTIDRSQTQTYIQIHHQTPADGFSMSLGDHLIFEHVNIYFTCTGH